MMPTPPSPLRNPTIQKRIDEIIHSRPSISGWSLVVDGDRTLAEPDTGRAVGMTLGVNQLIRSVFEAHGYTTAAFQSVCAIWSAVPCDEYIARIDTVAATLRLYPAWLDVLAVASELAPIIVVTSGIPQVWTRVLDRHGLTDILVLGGCHAALDDCIVDSESKRSVVESMQRRGLRVIAAGDSLIDAPMLRQADLPIIVPDSKENASLRDALGDATISRTLDIGAGQRFPFSPPITSHEIVEMLRHDH
jgi:phosphoserine phosphatase